MEKRRNFVVALKLACVFAGLVFGAGFASGREHLTYFLQYGWWGVGGVLLAGVVMALSGWAVMDICVRHGIRDYRSFMRLVFGARFGVIFDIVTGLFIFVLFSAMLAGAGALGQESVDLPFSLGSMIIAFLCFVILLSDAKGIIEMNVIITPILVIGALSLGIYTIVSGTYVEADLAYANAAAMPLMALVYASYNMLTAIAVLSAIPTIVTSKKIARAGGILGGVVITAIGIIFAVALLLNLPIVRFAQLPVLALAGHTAPWVFYAYTFILFLAIFTTAATNAFALIKWLQSRTGFSKMQLKILVCATGVTAAHLGFSTIVNHAYRAFGFLGLFIITIILLRFFQNKKQA